MFFNEDGLLNIDELVVNNDSFKKIMEDGVVTEEEVKAQIESVVALIEKVQQMCNEEQLAAIKELIAEMNVLYTVYNYMNLKSIGE